MPRKHDPILTALLTQQAKAAADLDRWFIRLKRAFNAVDAGRRRLRRIRKRIDQHTAPKEVSP
jgi:hypothetical protein